MKVTSKNKIKGIVKGNKSVFEDFFTEFYPVLCVFANQFLNNPNQSKDVAQDAFIKYWEKKHEFNDFKGVKSFLYVVVKNNCINLLKKTKKNVDVLFMKELESESFLKKNIITNETFFLVNNAIDSLPNRQREIIKLSLQGLKNPEIAEQLEISKHTVHSAKKVAYRKLKELLKENYYLMFFL